MAVPAVREAASSFARTRFQSKVPLANIGTPPSVTSGARYIMVIDTGPLL